MGKKNSLFTNCKASCSVLIMVFISIVSSKLSNKSFEGFVETNVQGLNKACTAAKDIRCCIVNLLEFGTKLICHLRGKGIKAKESRLLVASKIF